MCSKVIRTALFVWILAATAGAQTFSTPVNLSNSAGASTNPRIAVDSSGRIRLVWVDTSSGSGEILFRGSTDGGATFSSAVNLSSTAGPSLDPEVATDAAGNIHVLWREGAGATSNILLRRSTDGGASFSSAIDVTGPLSRSFNPRIAFGSGDGIYVVWDEKIGVDPVAGDVGETYFARSMDGAAAFSVPLLVSSSPGASSHCSLLICYSSLAVDPAGTIHVMWRDTAHGLPAQIYYSRSTDNGLTFSSPVNASNTLGNSQTPKIVTGASGLAGGGPRNGQEPNGSRQTGHEALWSTPTASRSRSW